MTAHSKAISSRQIKAARALLDWSQDDLAEASGLSIATIRKIEAGNTSPRGRTNAMLKKAFALSDIEFLSPNGVRQRPQEITILEGASGVGTFYDDLYNHASKHGGEYVVVCPYPDDIYLKGEHKERHIKRMMKLKHQASVKCIITDDNISTPAKAYCDYKYLPKNYIASVPFYVYGTKCSFRTKGSDGTERIIIIDSAELADAFYEQFSSLWAKGLAIDTEAG